MSRRSESRRATLCPLALLSLCCLCLTPSVAASQTGDAASVALARELAAKQTPAERITLLDARKEFLTAGVCRALVAEGEASRVAGKNPQAINTQEAAGEIATRMADKECLAHSLSSAGRALVAQNKYKEAHERFDRSLAAWREIGEMPRGLAETLNHIAFAHYAQRNMDKAQEFYTRALTVAERTSDATGRAGALNGQGVVAQFKGEYDAALKLFEQSRIVGEAAGDKERVGSSLHNTAMIFSARGEFARATENFTRSLKIFEELGAKPRAANTLNSLGNIYRSLNDYAASLRHFQRAFAFAEAAEDKNVMAMVLNNLGLIYLDQGDAPLALAQFQRSFRLREEVGNLALATIVLENIAGIYLRQGRYAEALATLDKALPLAERVSNRRSVAFILNRIAQVQVKRGDNEAAFNAYRKALALFMEMNNEGGAGDVLTGLAALHNRRSEFTQALTHADQATANSRRSGTLHRLWLARTVAGDALRGLNKPAEARLAYTEAIDALERMRFITVGGERERRNFFDDKLAPYAALVEMLAAEGKTFEALQYAEQAKARVLLDVVRSGRTTIEKFLTTGETQRDGELKRLLGVANERLAREQSADKPDPARLKELLAAQDAARNTYEAWRTSLHAAHPELKVRSGEANTLDRKQLATLLPNPATALIEYSVGEDRTLLFVMTKPAASADIALRVVTIPLKRGELARRVARFRDSIAQRDITFTSEAASLHQLLLAPVAAELRDHARLVIVPDGALWELPFQALITPQGNYIVEHHAISYTPSLSVLAAMVTGHNGSTSNNTRDLLAFGNPSAAPTEISESQTTNGTNTPARVEQTRMMNTSLASLPDAERQVKALGTLFGANRSRIYTRAEAAESKFKSEAGAYRILHIASHGILDDRNPMYSHVLLAGDGARTPTGEDGQLEAWELMNMNLRASMVVLSACETARGQVSAGEGVIGLSWALFVAGSPTTVASGWKVESASTTNLMLAFYRNLRGGASAKQASRSMTKAEALRQASLTLLRSEEYSHPFYWAGFVIVGDGN